VRCGHDLIDEHRLGRCRARTATAPPRPPPLRHRLTPRVVWAPLPRSRRPMSFPTSARSVSAASWHVNTIAHTHTIHESSSCLRSARCRTAASPRAAVCAARPAAICKESCCSSVRGGIDTSCTRKVYGRCTRPVNHFLPFFKFLALPLIAASSLLPLAWSGDLVAFDVLNTWPDSRADAVGCM